MHDYFLTCSAVYVGALALASYRIFGARWFIPFLITSTCSGEGKTYLSVNLALSLAVAGKKVLLMEGARAGKNKSNGHASVSYTHLRRPSMTPGWSPSIQR